MFEKEADEYADNQIGCGDGYYEWTDVTQAYQKGAEFGYNKAKEEMQEQIEKMKCCGNCKYFNFNEPNYCHKGVYRERQYVCSEWEFGN